MAKKYIDKIIDMASKYYDSFTELKREVESKIKCSIVDLVCVRIGVQNYFIPAVLIGSKKLYGIDVPRKVFYVWIARYPEDGKEKVSIKVQDMGTGEQREIIKEVV